jgi:cytochrome P450
MEASFFTFGAGHRACIGKNFTLMEIHKIVPQLLREYKIELAQPEKEWEVRNVWFVLPNSSLVRCKLLWII